MNSPRLAITMNGARNSVATRNTTASSSMLQMQKAGTAYPRLLASCRSSAIGTNFTDPSTSELFHTRNLAASRSRISHALAW